MTSIRSTSASVSMPKLNAPRGVGGIVHRHAVAQHQHLIGIGAANKHAGVAARSAGLADMDAGNRGQRVGQRRVAALLDGLAVDHRDAGGNVDDRRRDARRGDHSFRRHLRRLVGERGRCDQCEHKSETEPQACGSSIDKRSTARLRVHPRCTGTPRPRHARSLDTGRSPGSRVVAWSRLLALRQWHRGTGLAAHSCGGSSLALGRDPRV